MAFASFEEYFDNIVGSYMVTNTQPDNKLIAIKLAAAEIRTAVAKIALKKRQEIIHANTQT